MKQFYEQGRKSEERIVFGRPSRHACLSVVACMQDDVHEQYADIDSDTTL
jgi:hypothetical protein